MRELSSGPHPVADRALEPSRSGWRAVLAPLVMLAAVLIAGCSATGADEPTRAGNTDGYVGAVKSVTIIDPTERLQAPDIKGVALGEDDKEISTADLAGKVVVLNVWGSWCAPCVAETPDLQKAWASYSCLLYTSPSPRD